ncbi:MAG TPA: tetratricopeptide repeat protein [Stellaceae bacterium]|nr:tetratricopeptide repeat protein [Stellaceae bacterium]
MRSSSDDPLSGARALYQRTINPARTQEIRRLLDQSAAETAAYSAITALCQYLNHWPDAGPAEVASAEAAVELALADSPQRFIAHYAQGFLYRTRGQHEAAVNAFDETIRLAPEFARAYAQKGEDLVFLGRVAEAIVEVRRALEISPQSSVRGYFYWVMGHAYFVMHEDGEAVRWLRDSVRNWPDVWYNRLYLVSAHALADELTPARRALQTFNRRFSSYRIANVIESESVVPDDNAAIHAERERFHDGLRRAGMNP